MTLWSLFIRECENNIKVLKKQSNIALMKNDMERFNAIEIEIDKTNRSLIDYNKLHQECIESYIKYKNDKEYLYGIKIIDNNDIKNNYNNYLSNFNKINSIKSNSYLSNFKTKK